MGRIIRHEGHERGGERRVLGQAAAPAYCPEMHEPVQVLAVCARPEVGQALRGLRKAGMQVARASDAEVAGKAADLGVDVLLIDEQAIQGAAAWGGLVLKARRAGAQIVIVTQRARAVDDRWARELGAAGVCAVPHGSEVSVEALALLLQGAAARSRALRGAGTGPHRRNIARDRASSSAGVSGEVAEAQMRIGFSDVQADPRRSPDMSQVSIASEFKGLIKHELDIEALLRTTLEFVLSRSGPTNAAIFLPTTSGDFSLGAYVNYDCPKDTCDILLDHMANVVAPKFERQIGIAHMTTAADLKKRIGEDAAWLGESAVAAMACRHEGETLAIFLLFRDRRSAYPGGVLDQVKTVGELFAAQLARVIHIHHRHLPKDKWGMLGDAPADGESDGYGDLAA